MRVVFGLILARHEQIILFLMLELLHLSVWIDPGSPVSRSLMLVHLGLFLIWQPVWRSDEKLNWYNGLIFAALALGIFTWLNPWIIYGWLVLLIGFVGGRVLTDKHERITYIITLFFLVLELLINCTAQLVDIHLKISDSFEIIYMLLPLSILFIPAVSREKRSRSVDILHAIMTSMFACLLSLGSLLFMFISHSQYIPALAQTTVTIGIFMLIISWLLTPRGGFSGLYQLWTHSLLNIGTPFEHWLSELSELARIKQGADEFLEAAMEELVAMPWITGVQWQTQGLNETRGTLTSHGTELNFENLNITIYARSLVGGALLLHCTLLVKLISNYYVAKQHERELTRQTQLKAIYETGSRITHDIKNLLQSLLAITSILQYEKNDGAKSVSQKIIERQLPNLTQRLQLALDKLQAPQSEVSSTADLKDWWQDLKGRNHPPNITFQADINGSPLIPVELFDSVIDNLLENINSKSKIENDIEITVTLSAANDHVSMTICDTGSMIPEHLSRRLFLEPMESNNGLGIGLYQAARQAQMMGYSLGLKNNQSGRVCFELTNTSARG